MDRCMVWMDQTPFPYYASFLSKRTHTIVVVGLPLLVMLSMMIALRLNNKYQFFLALPSNKQSQLKIDSMLYRLLLARLIYQFLVRNHLALVLVFSLVDGI